MAIARDLLALAEHLTEPVANSPELAWLRRAISTGYYALFHLLVSEASKGWTGSSCARLGSERAFRHDQMREVCRSVANGSWKGWSTPRLMASPELWVLANSFVKSQEARHLTDYNNEIAWTQSDVAALIAAIGSAFRMWDSVQGTEVADEFLLSLLIGKKRE